MNTVYSKQVCAVITIAINTLICIFLFLPSFELDLPTKLWFALLPAAQILLIADFMKYLHRENQKEEEKRLEREGLLRQQKKENDELHSQRVKQKFEQRMQKYDDNALARKRKKTKPTKRTAETVSEEPVPDPEELKELLSKDHLSSDTSTANQNK
jgi:ABC-type bacteriocin/lantibiotic exporter with double-glycine peptidase domain